MRLSQPSRVNVSKVSSAGCDHSHAIADDYVEVPQGDLTWTPARRQERLWWVIGAGTSRKDAHVEWETQGDFSDCDEDQPCTCLSFQAFELSRKGDLLEVERSVVYMQLI